MIIKVLLYKILNSKYLYIKLINCILNICITIIQFFFLYVSGDQELVSFLEDEIKEEKKSLTPKVPGVLNEFTIKHDRSQLILSRKFHDEE